jgi:hypothetical protein
MHYKRFTTQYSFDPESNFRSAEWKIKKMRQLNSEKLSFADVFLYNSYGQAIKYIIPGGHTAPSIQVKNMKFFHTHVLIICYLDDA